MTSTFTTQATLWDWYSVVDPGGVQFDTPGAVPETSLGGATGLVGKYASWKATIVPQQRWGESKLTVEVHDSPPPAQTGYTRTGEADFEVLSGEVYITEWGGEPIHRVNIPSGNWRLRVYAREGKDDGEDIVEMEEHLLQMWPG
ncbi:MAG TPA: hypothetical protein VGV93_02600 [Acidimicrobiales bacterium]|nr:hypothetical protein [Acidimicrobiales bacterium]